MINIKQSKRFVLLLLVVFFLSTGVVFAAWTDMLVEISTVMQDLASAFGGGQALEGFLRFCIFVIMYSILYGAASAIPKMKENKSIMRAMNIFALVMALTVAILIQSDQLLYIFKLYYAILVVLFAILPALVGFLVNRRLLQGDQPGYPFIRGIIYLIIAAVLWFVIKTLTVTSSPETAIFDQILGPLKWGALFAFIAGIFNMIMLVPGVRNAIPQGLGGTRGQQGQQQGAQGSVQQPTTPATPQQMIQGIPAFEAQLQAIAQSYGQILNIRQQILNNPNDPQNQQRAQNIVNIINALQPNMDAARVLLQQLWPNIQQLPETLRNWFEQGVIRFLQIEGNIAFILQEVVGVGV